MDAKKIKSIIVLLLLPIDIILTSFSVLNCGWLKLYMEYNVPSKENSTRYIGLFLECSKTSFLNIKLSLSKQTIAQKIIYIQISCLNIYCIKYTVSIFSFSSDFQTGQLSWHFYYLLAQFSCLLHGFWKFFAFTKINQNYLKVQGFP